MPTPQGFVHVVHQLLLIGDPEPMVVTYGAGLQEAELFEPIDIAGALHGIFDTRMSAIVSSRYTLHQTQVYVGTGDPMGDLTAIFVEDQPMAGSIDCAPQNCAFLVHKLTNRAGRRGKGRFYLPGIPESVVDNAGGVASAFQGTMNTALAAFLADIAALPDLTGMVLIHNEGVTAVPAAPTPVTQLVVDRMIATQRRRLRR